MAPAVALKYSTMQDARAFAEYDLDGNQQLDFEEFYASALHHRCTVLRLAIDSVGCVAASLAVSESACSR